MKKPIKITIISVVTVGIIVGGLYTGYTINQKSKTADVCPLSNYSMDDYWGDSIESYGTVASDKSQIIYLSSSDKIKSIEVKEGDEVKVGDVLMVVDSAASDLKGKSLELEQEKNKLKVAQTKLERLQKTIPVPDADNMYEKEVKKSREYKAKVVYVTSGESGLTNYPQADMKLAEEIYDKDGKLVSTTYYDALGGTISKEQFESAAFAGKALSEITCTTSSENSKYEWTSQVDYVNAKTGAIIGSDKLNEDGDAISSFDMDGKYTETELANAIFEQQQETKKLDLSVRKHSLELKQATESSGNGEILAKVDGKVTKVQDINNINYNGSILAVSGTDEYYISGTVGEFYLDKVSVGDSCEVNSWETGTTVEAKITEIETFPDLSENYGNGNSNSSNYPFKAAFDIGSGIEIGDAVNISITSSKSEGGFYIYQAFVRKDKTGNYVMLMDENNKLKKVPVTTGKSLWGSYVEITSGNLSMEDYIAFPYGNGAIEGVSCEIKDYLDY